jgi:hypothetical protein
VAIEHQEVGSPSTLTFLDRDLQEATLPKLDLSRTSTAPVSMVTPFQAGEEHRGVVVAQPSPKSAFNFFSLINGQWELLRTVSRWLQLGGTRVIQTNSGTQVIAVDYSGAKLFATAWTPSRATHTVWERSIQRSWGDTAVVGSIRLQGEEEYAVLKSGQQLRIIPCRAKQERDPGIEWSLRLPVDLKTPFTVYAAPLGKNSLFIIQGEGSGFTRSRALSSRWLLMPNGNARELGLSEELDLGTPLGVVQTPVSVAEYFYHWSSKRVVRSELLRERPPPAARSASVQAVVDPRILRVVMMFLTLFTSLRYLEAKLRLPSLWHSRWAVWAEAVLVAGVCLPGAGLVVGALQEHYSSKDQPWISLLGLAVAAAWISHRTWDQPLPRAAWGWGFASFIAWNRSWHWVHSHQRRAIGL